MPKPYRIALVGWQHETNTFSPQPTGLAEFTQADSWPGLVRGETVLTALQDCNIPMSGAIAAAASEVVELLPIMWCSATPSGKVTTSAFTTLLDEIIVALSALAELDAVYLDLHGYFDLFA